MQDDPFQGQRPEIDYPTAWGYRVIGASEEALRALVAEVVADAEHEIHAVQPSRKGAYVSLRMTVTVRDEAHRDAVYQQLMQAEVVKLVL